MGRLVQNIQVTIGYLISNVFWSFPPMTIFRHLLGVFSGIFVFLYLIIFPRECTGQQPMAHSFWEYAIQVCEVMLQLQLHAYRIGEW